MESSKWLRMGLAFVVAFAIGGDAAAQYSALGGKQVEVPGIAIEPGDAVDLGYALTIGPIDGLTTGWHEAPVVEAWVCMGTEIVLHQDAPAGAEVVWHGAGLVVRGEGGREVVCVMNETGVQRIVAEVRTGGARQLKECTFRVVDYPHNRVIQWRRFGVEDASPEIRTDWDNMDRLDAYFRGSIAGLTEVGQGRYVIASDTWLRTRAHAWPRGFEPLLELRVDDRPVALGSRSRILFENVGEHVVEVGTPGRAPSATIEVYDVTITSHIEGVDLVQDGVDVVFEAETAPAGYEQYITWLSATKYGTGEPMTGRGGRFEVRFDDTFGPWAGGAGDWSWLGVRADNVAFGQDQKLCRVLNGFVHCPLGDATLQLVAGPDLKVDNIDNVGGDGVRVEFSPVAATAFTDGTRSDTAPISISLGERLETEMVGSINGSPTGSLGFGGVENPAGTLTVFGDFFAQSCPNVLVEVFNGGVLQGSFVRAAGQVAQVTGGNIISVGQKEGTLEYVLDSVQTVTPILPGGIGLVGDEIHLSPDGCPLASGPGILVGAIECFEIRIIFIPPTTLIVIITTRLQ